MDCTPEILYKTDRGAVMRCPDCGITQVAYGSSHYILQLKEFNHLRKKLKTVIGEASQKQEYLDDKKFSIPLKDHYCRLWLSVNEVEELHQMLEQATWMKMVNEALGS